jgi:hypothetical protein
MRKTVDLLRELEALAASPVPKSVSIDINREDADTVVKACRKLSPTSIERLLTMNPDSMVFMSKAVLENPRTAFDILCHSFNFITRAGTTPAKPKNLPRLPTGMSKRNIIDFVLSLARNGVGSSAWRNIKKSQIKVTRSRLGQHLHIPVSNGTKYADVMAFRDALSQKYKIMLAHKTLLAGNGGVTVTDIVITSIKKKG